MTSMKWVQSPATGEIVNLCKVESYKIKYRKYTDGEVYFLIACIGKREIFLLIDANQVCIEDWISDLTGDHSIICPDNVFATPINHLEENDR